MKKFSEIAKDDIHLAGEKLNLQDIVGKPIVITGYKITKSKFKTVKQDSRYFSGGMNAST